MGWSQQVAARLCVLWDLGGWDKKLVHLKESLITMDKLIMRIADIGSETLDNIVPFNDMIGMYWNLKKWRKK